jgi:peroxiredoxin
MDLFKDMYSYYLNFSSTGNDGKQLFTDIVMAKSIHAIKQTFNKNIQLQDDTLKELIVLQGIHDAFYYKSTGEYKSLPKAQLFQVLDSINIKSRISEHKIIAKNIREKALILMPGTKALDFKLKNEKGKFVNLIDSKKYIYIGFIHTQSLSCKEELLIMRDLIQKYKKDIDFVCISLDDDFSSAKQYFDDNSIDATLLDGSRNNELLKKYQISVFPTYYLISKKGVLLLSPAPSIRENFEAVFVKDFKSQEPQLPKEYDDLFKTPGFNK